MKTKRPRFARSRRIRAVVVCILLVGAFAWLAATRWNGVPADPRGVDWSGSGLPPLPIDPEHDRTAQLLAVVAAFPPLPLIANCTLPPAPEGMRWGPFPFGPGAIDPSDACGGDWTPETRPHLQAVIKYLEDPAVEVAIDKFAIIEPGGWRSSTASRVRMREIAKTIVAHSRYVLETKGDIDAAIDDIEALLHLASIISESRDTLNVLLAMADESLAETELRHLALEQSLTRSQSKRITQIIESSMPDKSACWGQWIDASIGELELMVDLCYTEDVDGDGWFVLSRMANIQYPDFASVPRSGAWNTLSPFFNSRRTVVGKIARLRSSFESVRAMSYGAAQRRLAVLEARSPFSSLDGGLAILGSGQAGGQLHRMITSSEATRRACMVAAALSVYRSEHGQYPETLDSLVGDYLQKPFADPFAEVSGTPLRYLPLDDGENYLLYSVSDNQKDDGGQFGRDKDLVFSNTRRPCYAEPELEEVPQ